MNSRTWSSSSSSYRSSLSPPPPSLPCPLPPNQIDFPKERDRIRETMRTMTARGIGRISDETGKDQQKKISAGEIMAWTALETVNESVANYLKQTKDKELRLKRQLQDEKSERSKAKVRQFTGNGSGSGAVRAGGASVSFSTSNSGSNNNNNDDNSSSSNKEATRGEEDILQQYEDDEGDPEVIRLENQRLKETIEELQNKLLLHESGYYLKEKSRKRGRLSALSSEGEEEEEKRDRINEIDVVPETASLVKHLRIELEQSQQQRKMEKDESMHKIAILTSNNDKLSRQIKFLSEEEKALQKELEIAAYEKMKTKRKLEEEINTILRSKVEVEENLQKAKIKTLQAVQDENTIQVLSEEISEKSDQIISLRNDLSKAMISLKEEEHLRAKTRQLTEELQIERKRRKEFEAEQSLNEASPLKVHKLKENLLNQEKQIERYEREIRIFKHNEKNVVMMDILQQQLDTYKDQLTDYERVKGELEQFKKEKDAWESQLLPLIDLSFLVSDSISASTASASASSSSSSSLSLSSSLSTSPSTSSSGSSMGQRKQNLSPSILIEVIRNIQEQTSKTLLKLGDLQKEKILLEGKLSDYQGQLFRCKDGYAKLENDFNVQTNEFDRIKFSLRLKEREVESLNQMLSIHEQRAFSLKSSPSPSSPFASTATNITATTKTKTIKLRSGIGIDDATVTEIDPSGKHMMEEEEEDEEETVFDLKAELNKKQREIEALSQDLELKANHIATLERLKEETTDDITALDARMTQYSSDTITSYRNRIAELENLYHALEKENSQLKEKLSTAMTLNFKTASNEEQDNHQDQEVKQQQDLQEEQEGKISNLDYNPATTKIVHMKINPKSSVQATKQKVLEEENAKLRQAVEKLSTENLVLQNNNNSNISNTSISFTSPTSTTLNVSTFSSGGSFGGICSVGNTSFQENTEEVNQGKLNIRLKQMFRERIKVFREAVYLLTGYKLSVSNELNNPRIELTNMFAEQESDVLIFQFKEKEGLQLLDSDFARRLEGQDQQLKLMTLLRTTNCIPAFLSELTLYLHGNTSRQTNF